MNAPFAMEWRVVERAPEYEVSEFGDVRRRVAGYNRPVGYRLKGRIDQDGYLQYSFRIGKRKFSVTAHRLVAEAFIGPAPSPLHEVAHASGSRLSCLAHDLRWAKRVENDADTNVHGTARKGEKNGRAKISEEDVRRIRTVYREAKASRGRVRLKSLSERYDLHPATIIDIATGKSWRHVPLEDLS